MATVRDVLDGIASFVNQDPTLVTGTDLTSQINYIDRGQRYWSNKYQWKALRKPYALPFSASMASVALPGNFKKLMSPVYNVAKSTPDSYSEILPQDRFMKLSSDLYCVTGGNLSDGQYININPPVPSGASLVLDYQSYPSSLTTLQDVLTCPSTEYLVNYSLYELLAARSDPRFPTYKAESDSLLGDMMEEEAAPSGGQINSTRNSFSRSGFVLGRD